MRILSAHVLLKNSFKSKHSFSPLIGSVCWIVSVILKVKANRRPIAHDSDFMVWQKIWVELCQ